MHVAKPKFKRNDFYFDDQIYTIYGKYDEYVYLEQAIKASQLRPPQREIRSRQYAQLWIKAEEEVGVERLTAQHAH
jgi:hypothetical protein